MPSLYGLCLGFAAGVRSHAGFLLLSCLKQTSQQKDQLVSGPCGFNMTNDIKKMTMILFRREAFKTSMNLRDLSLNESDPYESSIAKAITVTFFSGSRERYCVAGAGFFVARIPP